MTIAICRRVARGTGPCPHPNNCTCFPLTTQDQGKIVIERGEANGYLLMFPTGAVSWRPTKRSAEQSARRWFKANAGGADIGVGRIEWH